jgi:hypothetical protein
MRTRKIYVRCQKSRQCGKVHLDSGNKNATKPSSDDVLVLELTVIYLESLLLVISTQQFASFSVKK